MFAKILRFFGLKIYTSKEIRQFCEKQVITEDQYKAITGEDF